MADRIIAFEGRRISVPADASDAEVAEILGGDLGPSPGFPTDANARPTAPNNRADGTQEHWYERSPVPESSRRITPTPGLAARVGENLRFGSQAAGEGIANLIGFPTDAATAVLVNPAIFAKNTLFGGETPFVKEPTFGSEFLKNTMVRPAAQAAGGAVDPDKLSFPRRAVFEGIGGASGGVAAGGGILALGLRRAATLAAQRAAGEPLLPRFLDQTMKSYADGRGAAVARDAAAGFGSGVGLAAAKELPPSARDAGGGLGGWSPIRQQASRGASADSPANRRFR
ncbi:hypothetical protein [Bosea sp. MMO-172]|uniref:hypothetical protein n=1 Tax=Bosea sp. MMO-172 TaxID=3127885 RepID=UPI003015A943